MGIRDKRVKSCNHIIVSHTPPHGQPTQDASAIVSNGGRPLYSAIINSLDLVLSLRRTIYGLLCMAAPSR